MPSAMRRPPPVVWAVRELQLMFSYFNLALLVAALVKWLGIG
jgi:hypothetical protein